MTNGKISVVIPTHNEEEFIEDCLKSFMTQKEKPDELIIVDNNCTDNTIEIAKRFPVRIVTEKKQSIIAAIKKGFDEARYDIIARTDADTRVPSNWIQAIKKNFVESDIEALTGLISYYEMPIKTTLFSKIFFDIMKLISGHEVLIGPNMAITKKMWNNIRKNICMDNKAVHEDIDLAFHINEIKGTIKRDNKLVTYTSNRRMKKNSKSFFVEYPFRLFKTISAHNNNLKKIQNKIL